MAGYRPKSLDELNNIFDKTMAAEKAIKKGSSLLEKGEDGFSSFSEQVGDELSQDLSSEEKQSEEITDSVSDFIAKFTVQTQTEPVKAKPQMTVITPEPVRKEYEIGSDDSAAETESAAAEAEKSSRDELFDEYMKIMSDEDDDPPAEKKLSRKEKKRLKKKEKAESKISEEHLPEESVSEEEPVKDENIPFEEVAEEALAEEPVIEEAEQDFSAEEKDDFDFPENYTPEWLKENESSDNSHKEEDEKAKINFGKTVLKIILSLVLIAVISTGTFATLLKTVVAPNTGKLVADKYYVFTTYRDYTDMGIAKDALIITEKKYAGQDEFFVYVDYANKTFELGKRTDSITKEDGEVLYVTEKDGGRTLVSRDDCKGVVYLTYESRGRIVSFLTDNYIIIVAAAAVISLVIILLFALVLRNRKDDEYEDFEEELSEEEEEDFDDIFSTIE